MNRSRMLVLAGFTLALSVVVTLLAYRVLKNRLRPSDDTVQIVVAADKLSLGTRLAAADVRTAAWPKNVPLPGSFQKPEDVIGRGVIINMSANEPVLESKLAPKEGGAGLTSAIPEGMRAVSVKVNDVIGVAGFVVPGTRVDVILSGSRNKDNNGIEESKVILENVQVLAAGQNVDQDANGKPQNVQVITLLVKPEDAQRLALATSGDGRIQLALRNPLDLQYANPEAVQKASLFGGPSGAELVPALAEAGKQQKKADRKLHPRVQPVVKKEEPKAAPAPPPPPKMLHVELIEGNKSKVSSFEEKPAKPAESTAPAADKPVDKP